VQEALPRAGIPKSDEISVLLIWQQQMEKLWKELDSVQDCSSFFKRRIVVR